MQIWSTFLCMAQHRNGVGWWLAKKEDNSNRVLVVNKKIRITIIDLLSSNRVCKSQFEKRFLYSNKILHFDFVLGFESIFLINFLCIKFPLHYDISILVSKEARGTVTSPSLNFWCKTSRPFKTVPKIFLKFGRSLL